MEAFGRFGLVPVALLQHVHDDVPLAIFHDIEQRSVAAMLQAAETPCLGPQCGREASSGPISDAGGEHDRALDYIFQFAHIARPGIGQQRPQAFRSDAPRGRSFSSEYRCRKKSDQQRNIFFALPQRRQVDGDDVQPVKEIFAELAFAHLLFQVHIGGGNDAHVHLQVHAPRPDA